MNFSNLMKCSGKLLKTLIEQALYFRLSVPASYFKKFEQLAKVSKKKRASSSGRVEKLFAAHLKGVIADLLGQSRIASVVVRDYSMVN